MPKQKNTIADQLSVIIPYRELEKLLNATNQKILSPKDRLIAFGTVYTTDMANAATHSSTGQVMSTKIKRAIVGTKIQSVENPI